MAEQFMLELVDEMEMKWEPFRVDEGMEMTSARNSSICCFVSPERFDWRQ